MANREYSISTFGLLDKRSSNKAERQGAKRTIRRFEDTEHKYKKERECVK